MFNANYGVNFMFKRIKERLDLGWFVSSGSWGGSDQKFDWNGLAYGHAYSILDAVELTDGTKLLQVRNPWGHEKYHGPFSDNSDLWKDHTELNHTDVDDGLWWIDAETYFESMSFTSTSPNLNSDFMTYFALFEVEGELHERVQFESNDN